VPDRVGSRIDYERSDALSPYPLPRRRAASSDDSRADFLKVVPIFAGLPESLRRKIATRSSEVRLPAGEWLFRQGDEGDSLYVVRSGRLEVVIESPNRTVARRLSRGSVVGELALLTREPRSASVRARRDSELLVLTSTDFAELISHEPRFSLALMRELGARLRESRAVSIEDDPLPATIALVCLERGLAPELCDRLRGALARHGSVCLLNDSSAAGESDFGLALDRAERSSERVLLLATDPGGADPWSAFCLRQADRIVVIAGARSPPPDLTPRLRGCDVVVSDPVRPQLARMWAEAVDPHALHAVGSGAASGTGVERLARRLAGRSLGVVLSSGGARGFAHIGVLDELLAAGLVIDRMAGCSMGAFVGAMFASGLSPAEIRARCHKELVLGRPMSDYAVPITSLLRGGRALSMLRRTFGAIEIEQLEREFYCVSCDLVSGAQVVHRRGPVVEAVAPSMCLPGIFPPIPREGRLLVDGGVLDSLPVGPMAAAAEGPIVAVDVGRRFEHAPRAHRRGRAALPTAKETVARSIVLGSIDGAKSARRRADLLIEPRTGACGMLDFKRLDEMIEAGRRAAREALANDAVHLAG